MSAGKSPAQDRALELLRQGHQLAAVSNLVGVPHKVIKVWAKHAGIVITPPSEAQMAEGRDRWKRTRAAMRVADLKVTATRVRTRIVGDRKPG